MRTRARHAVPLRPKQDKPEPKRQNEPLVHTHFFWMFSPLTTPRHSGSKRRTQTSSFRAQTRNPCSPALQLGCCDYAQHDGVCRAPLPPSPSPFPTPFPVIPRVVEESLAYQNSLQEMRRLDLLETNSSPLTPHPSPLTPHPSPLTPHPSLLSPFAVWRFVGP